jgi:uncharacterized membrane protein YagU involved in acid resistance
VSIAGVIGEFDFSSSNLTYVVVSKLFQEHTLFVHAIFSYKRAFKSHYLSMPIFFFLLSEVKNTHKKTIVSSL